MRLIVAVTAVAALAAGPALAQSSWTPPRSTPGFGSTVAPRSPPQGYPAPSAYSTPSVYSRPSGVAPAQKIYGAPEPPKPEGFKPYKPYKPSSVYGSKGP